MLLLLRNFDPDFHLGAWSKPNTTARHCRLTSLLVFAKGSNPFLPYKHVAGISTSSKWALTLISTLALRANQTPPLGSPLASFPVGQDKQSILIYFETCCNSAALFYLKNQNRACLGW
ncbi:hypothetical protein B6N13_18045 [Marinomonas sp. UCMA 3892]|uniref:hypothetical protein n=1 Tax=unclassified Marinomonas TaxID=196814 RepID=UPI00146EBD81|nr:hypothetical protein [Marinomonas sp. UCMA 3892]NLU99974.1 hypothetical protein [Marinomonas sp. UCMA 3892]